MHHTPAGAGQRESGGLGSGLDYSHHILSPPLLLQQSHFGVLPGEGWFLTSHSGLNHTSKPPVTGQLALLLPTLSQLVDGQ